MLLILIWNLVMLGDYPDRVYLNGEGRINFPFFTYQMLKSKIYWISRLIITNYLFVCKIFIEKQKFYGDKDEGR